MPSQDEYLDNLLKDLLPEKIEGSDTAKSTAVEEPDRIENVDVVTEPTVTDTADFAAEPAAMDSADIIMERDTINSADIMESASAMGESDIVENVTGGAGSEKETEQALDMSDMDELLKAALDVDEEKPSEDTGGRGEMTDLNSMSEDDINRLLEEASRPEQQAAEESLQEGDLQDLLTAMNDEGSSEIRNLLDKADHNEPVDQSIEKLLKGEGMEEEINPLEDTAGIETEQKEDRAARRKRKREERKAAKEAKKKEKAAKRKRKSAKEGMEGSAENEEPLPEGSALFGENEASMTESAELFREAEEPLPEGIDYQEEGIASLTEGEALPEEIEALAGENAPKKKKNIFARFLEFLTEEDEEDEGNEPGDGSELKLSEENTAILKEMNQEEDEAGKSKKGKKEKPKKEKTKKEKPQKPKKEKKAKEPKPKKEKNPQNEPVQEEGPPAKKLPKKKVIITLLFAASIGGAILICTSLFTEFQVKKEGVTAFYEGDYQRCYQNLYGKDLNEQEQMLYAKSESILRMRVWLREYEILAGEGLEAEALDSLIQSVDDYPELYEYALQCNAAAEVETAYAQIVDILYNKYQLTEEQAKEIAAIPLDWDYTKAVLDIVAGGSYGTGEMPQEPMTGGEDARIQDLPDPLPEESDLAQIPFVDNNR